MALETVLKLEYAYAGYVFDIVITEKNGKEITEEILDEIIGRVVNKAELRYVNSMTLTQEPG